jgi:leader peptidase (prepilin peptidase)/N-methyltransferase
MSLILYRAYAALAGAAVGSFLNVCVYRWPLGLSVISPRSRCPGCDEPISWRDNIPVLGYLLLRGRCRNCSEPISVQYPLVELVTALIWFGAVVYLGLGLEAIRAATFLTILLGIALTDAKHMVIPDYFSLGGAMIGLGFAAAITIGIAAAAPGGVASGLGFPVASSPETIVGWIGYSLAASELPFFRALRGALIGYLLLLGVAYAGEKIFRKPALGLGDVHMMAMVGAFVGVPGMLLTVLLGSLLGLVIGVPFSWIRGKLVRLGTYLPLGTFLAMGAALTYIWGDAIIGWYLDFALGG